MATFADLAALMLTFFVLTYSMSVIDPVVLAPGHSQIDLPAGKAPDISVDFRDLTTPTKPDDAVDDKYILSLFVQDIRRLNLFASSTINLRDGLIEVAFEQALDDFNALQGQLSLVEADMLRLRQLNPKKISIVINGVSAAQSVSWLMNTRSVIAASWKLDEIRTKIQINATSPMISILIRP